MDSLQIRSSSLARLVKARRCCSPRDRMLAQSARQSRPVCPPASRSSSPSRRTARSTASSSESGGGGLAPEDCSHPLQLTC